MTPSESTALPELLVVEDEAMLLMLVTEVLRDTGFSVHEAPEASTALSILRSRPNIKLLLTDIRMPGMSGIQLADAAVALKPNLKIVLMTGYSGEAIPSALTDAGVQVLLKPFDTDKLPVILKTTLGIN